MMIAIRTTRMLMCLIILFLSTFSLTSGKRRLRRAPELLLRQSNVEDYKNFLRGIFKNVFGVGNERLNAFEVLKLDFNKVNSETPESFPTIVCQAYKKFKASVDYFEKKQFAELLENDAILIDQLCDYHLKDVSLGIYDNYSLMKNVLDVLKVAEKELYDSVKELENTSSKMENFLPNNINSIKTYVNSMKVGQEMKFATKREATEILLKSLFLHSPIHKEPKKKGITLVSKKLQSRLY